MLCGDMMHHAIQCRLPDWSSNFCTDQALARVTRRAFLGKTSQGLGSAGGSALYPAQAWDVAFCDETFSRGCSASLLGKWI